MRTEILSSQSLNGTNGHALVTTRGGRILSIIPLTPRYAVARFCDVHPIAADFLSGVLLCAKHTLCAAILIGIPLTLLVLYRG